MEDNKDNLEKLVNALQTLKETEKVATETCVEMKKQGDQLKKLNTDLKETHEELNRSRRLINKILKWWRS